MIWGYHHFRKQPYGHKIGSHESMQLVAMNLSCDVVEGGENNILHPNKKSHKLPLKICNPSSHITNIKGTESTNGKTLDANMSDIPPTLGYVALTQECCPRPTVQKNVGNARA